MWSGVAEVWTIVVALLTHRSPREIESHNDWVSNDLIMTLLPWIKSRGNNKKTGYIGGSFGFEEIVWISKFHLHPHFSVVGRCSTEARSNIYDWEELQHSSLHLKASRSSSALITNFQGNSHASN